jgi:hypothetical protein
MRGNLCAILPSGQIVAFTESFHTSGTRTEFRVARLIYVQYQYQRECGAISSNSNLNWRPSGTFHPAAHPVMPGSRQDGGSAWRFINNRNWEPCWT